MPKIGREEIMAAQQTLLEYQRGRKNLEEKLRDNENWYRLQHWKRLRPERHRRQTGWLFTTIVNKHADFMDNKPEVSVLPREKSDEETAKALGEILPVVLERAEWPKAYSRACLDKIKHGGGIYGVFWDPEMMQGLGDIRISRIDPMNFYWEPGIEDIQQSRNVFLTELIDHEALIEMYPGNKELKEKLSNPAMVTAKYDAPEDIDTSKKAVVVNWYYKREGLLHYCRYVQDIVLSASENDEKTRKEGWYRDGKYPFEIDVMFPEPGTPYGFGLIDAGRETQEDIDQLNDLTMKNAKIAAKRRFFVRNDCEINEEEFLDFDQDLVHFNGNLSDQSLKEIGAEPYSGTYVSILENKIQELKEITFNRDVNSGGTSGASNTAAGIAALQESGSKSSRDAIQTTYKSFQHIVEMVIERIRQFYNTPRTFRILNDDKTVRWETFSNEAMTAQPIGDGFGADFGTKEPIFDLDVRVSKANVWSRQAQNQDVLNFFGMGFFSPQNSTQALACLEVLDIDGKDKLIETIRANGLKEQFISQYLPILLQAAMAVDPNLAMAATQAAMQAGMIQQPTAQPGMQQTPQVADTGVAGQMNRSERYMDKQRNIANARTAPQA